MPNNPLKLPVPDGWGSHVKLAVLHVVSLAQSAMLQARGEMAEGTTPRGRRAAEQDQDAQEIALLREESRIKEERLLRIPAARRPHYSPAARLAILELKAARGWSLAQTAERFQVTAATISSWGTRIDEAGPEALVKLPAPVNKFPQLVGYLVERLKTLCPALGKHTIAETLARAGLHLSASTVARMLQEKSAPPPDPVPDDTPPPTSKPRVVNAKRPNHVWHVDLTVVPIAGGFWIPWLPFAWPQCFPFCWWTAVVVDHFSRRVMGTATFRKQPTSAQMCAFLGRAMAAAKASPRYLICDRGGQFDYAAFRAWCRRRKFRPRYGAVGKSGSIAVVERLIRTLKESIRQWPLVPVSQRRFRRELTLWAEWYNGHRPHMTLGGRTPDEVYHGRFPAHRRTRHEPRERWPRGSPCAGPWALVRGRPGAQLRLEVAYHGDRPHLPIITLRRAA